LSKLFHSCGRFGSSDEDVSSEDEYYKDDLLQIQTSIRSNILPTPLSPPSYVQPLLPTNPQPLNAKYWTEPCATSFSVRGPNYIKDRKKGTSEPCLFRLFAVDLIKVSKPILSGMCRHPTERVQTCLKAEKEGKPGSKMPPFIFCVNITLPGKPAAHHLVMYYAVDDISLISPPTENATTSNPKPNRPFQEIASKFFFGDSDEFRDSTFKLIPRIVTGNFVVKKAVGCKPTLLGKKVKQYYIQNDRFFELIVDVGSDSIANKVVGLSVGYAKTLVVDMGFLLEGKSKASLPEVLMGTVRLINIDFKTDLRVVEDYKP
jgi:hypothetical protein